MSTDNIPPTDRPPWRNAMLLIGFILIGMSVGNFASMFVAMMLNPSLSLDSLDSLLEAPEKLPNGWLALMLMQGITHLCTFLLASLAYWRIGETYRASYFLRRPKPSLLLVGFAMLTLLVYMPFNAWVIDLNQHMSLPETMAPLENWMRQQEDSLEKVTTFLTNFDTFWQLAIAVVIMAAIPAIGEEVLFRGIIQRKLFTKTRDQHLAIWVTAILFSAIHMQFYGFLPRMLLGAMFGYMYIWSASLWIPVAAHFFNNALAVVLIYLGHQKVIDFDEASVNHSMPVLASAVSLVLTAVLLSYFYQICQTKVTSKQINA